jgi:hypothetical protein
MSVEVRTLELVTDSTKSVSDLKSFETAIDSLSSKLLAFNAAKDKAFKSLASDWSRLGQQLKPILLEVSFSGLAPKFRQFQRHLLAHLRETQAMVDRHKIVLRTATSMASVAGAGAAAQASAAVATKQISEQALFSSVMGKKYADYDLRRLQSRKDLPRMTADLDTLLRDHWLMTEKQIKGFHDKYKQLNVNDKQRMEAMLRQTFSPGMAEGRAQRQADWVIDLAKQEGWHMPTIRPFLQEIRQKQKFVKEDPTKETLLDMARKYYASQGGKVGQRQMSIDEIPPSAGAAWYRDPRLMGPRFNKKIWQINEPLQTVHPRAMVAADRSSKIAEQVVSPVARQISDVNELKRAIDSRLSYLADPKNLDKTSPGYSTKDFLKKGLPKNIQDEINLLKSQRHALVRVNQAIQKELDTGFRRIPFGTSKDLDIEQDKLISDINRSLGLREASEREKVDKWLSSRSWSERNAPSRQSETHFRNPLTGKMVDMGVQKDWYWGTSTKQPVPNLIGREVEANFSKANSLMDQTSKKQQQLYKELDKVAAKTDEYSQKRVKQLSTEIQNIDNRNIALRDAARAFSLENKEASKSDISRRADTIQKSQSEINKILTDRIGISKKLENIEKAAERSVHTAIQQRAKLLQSRLKSIDTDKIDIIDTKKVQQASRDFDRLTKDSDKLEKSLHRAHQAGGVFSNTFAKLSIGMTALAATIFVFQNIAMWMRALLGPTLEFNEALVKIRKNIGGTRDDFLQMRESVELAASEFGMSADNAASTLEKYVKMGFSRSMAQEYVFSEAKANQDRFKEIETDTLNEAIEHFNREVKNLARAFGESGGFLQQAIEAIADFLEGARKATKERKDKQLQYAVNELALMKKMSDEELRRHMLIDEQIKRYKLINEFSGASANYNTSANYNNGGASANRGKQTYQIINERGESSHELINKWVKENYGFNTPQDLMDAYTKSTLENVRSKTGSFYSEKELWEKELEQRAKQERNERLSKAIKKSDVYITGYGESGGVRSLARQIEKIKSDFNETINVLKGYPQFSERINELIKIRDEYIQDAKNKQQEALQRASLNAFKKALEFRGQQWDFSADSPEQFFKSFLDQRGFKVDTEEKQRAFQQAVDKFENKIVSWQNAFGRVAADDTLSKELNKIAALERKAVAEHLDLAKAYENLTGSTKPLKDVIEKLRYETYKAAVEKDFDWAFKETYGVDFKEHQKTIDKYEAYRQSFLDLGPAGERVRNKFETLKINKLIQEMESNATGFLDKSDSVFNGKTPREFLEFAKSRVGMDAKEYTAYERAMMLDTDFGTVTMTEKEKAIYERQGHFTEMASAALMDYADEAEKTATKTYQVFQKAFEGMENSLVDFVMNGKLEWRSLAESIIADIARIQIQTAITGPLAKGFAPKSSGGGGWLSNAFNFVTGLSIFSAQGNMFNRYGLIPFATGGIVTKPTMFAFGQGGIGVMGEAGTEAIMPVTRTPSGDLGVKAIVGSGMTVNIYEAPGTKVTAEKSEDGNSLNIMVEQLEGVMLGRMQRDTGLAKYMDTRYKRNR